MCSYLAVVNTSENEEKCVGKLSISASKRRFNQVLRHSPRRDMVVFSQTQNYFFLVIETFTTPAALRKLRVSLWCTHPPSGGKGSLHTYIRVSRTRKR